jgi:hypothetical protein
MQILDRFEAVAGLDADQFASFPLQFRLGLLHRQWLWLAAFALVDAGDLQVQCSPHYLRQIFCKILTHRCLSHINQI